MVTNFFVAGALLVVAVSGPFKTLKLPMYPPFVLENPEVSVNAVRPAVHVPVKVVAGIVTVT